MDRTSRGSDAVEGSLAQVLARVAVRLQRIIQRSHLASLRYSHILRCIPAQMAPTYHTPGPSALFWLLLQPHLVLEWPAQFFLPRTPSLWMGGPCSHAARSSQWWRLGIPLTDPLERLSGSQDDSRMNHILPAFTCNNRFLSYPSLRPPYTQGVNFSCLP